MRANAAAEVYETGRVVGAGSYVCLACGIPVVLGGLDAVPECPTCGETRFRRASLFEQPTVDAPSVASGSAERAWLQRVREDLDATGVFLAFEDDDDSKLFEIPDGWTRIGRSVAAEIRLDDPTVSRRHALVVRTAEGKVRVLDDRSLNGVLVNGAQVDWSPLEDGDELTIGRYRLYLIEATPSRRRPSEAPTARA